MFQKFLLIVTLLWLGNEIFAQPVASFVARNDTDATVVRVCRGYNTNFTSISQGATSVSWTFASGTPATSTNTSVNVVWNTNGTFNCSLTASDLTASNTINFTVVVSNNQPTVTFAPIPDMCTSDPPKTFPQATPPGGQFFGPGIVNNKFNAAVAGLGTHTLGYVFTGFNGCADTAYSSVFVKRGPTANLLELNNFSNCNGFSFATPAFEIELYDASATLDTITNYKIIWGDGTASWDSSAFRPGIKHTYTSQGLYQLQYVLTSLNGCTDTAKFLVVNTSNPASLNMVNPGGTNGCAPVTVTFPISTTNTDTTIMYTIDWGDGKDTTFKHPPPAFVTHIYDTTSCIKPGGFFNIIATATNACVSTQSILQGPFVTQPAVADFVADPGCAGEPHVLGNNSIPGYTNACSRLSTFIWDFGDGTPPVTILSSSPLPPPGNHTWANPGTYNVTLIVVSNGSNCPGDTVSYEVCIEDAPDAIVSMSNLAGCQPLTPVITNSTDTTTDCTLKIPSWTISPATGWSLAQGSSLSDLQPNVTFTEAGIYTMTFFVTNNCGADSVVFTIDVSDVPDVSLPQTGLDYCDTAYVNTATSPKHMPTISSNGSPITSYFWQITPPATFLNGTSATSQYPEFVLNPASYSIILFATNACGTRSDTQNFAVNLVTYGGFSMSADEGCTPLTVSLNSTSNPLVQHEWYINGVLYSNSVDTSVTMVNTGLQDSTYEVTLIVFSSAACADTIRKYVVVRPAPQALFSATEECLSKTTMFYDSSIVLNAPINSWNWDFGDGTLGSGQSVSHTYGAPGKYGVILTVQDTNGCLDSYSDSVWVRSYPAADMFINYSSAPDSACINDSIFFNDVSTVDANGTPIVSWSWDIFNDGTVESTNQNTSYVFASPGLVPVKLVVTNATGCKDSIVDYIKISVPPQPSFTLSRYGGCTPVSVTANNLSSGYFTGQTWHFYTLDSNQNKITEYLTTSANPNPIPPFNANILSNKLVFVELTTFNSCYTASFIDSINIRPVPIPFFMFSSDTGCSPLTVSIQVDGLATGNPDSIVFNYGDGSPLFILKPVVNILPNGDTLYTWNQQSHTFTYTGNKLDTTYFVTLWASNECGDSSYTASINVRNRSLQAFFTPSTNITCSPNTITFTDYSFNATSVAYCFDFDTIAKVCNGSSAFGRNVSYTYQQPGTYVVAQFTYNWCGSDTAYQVIELRPRPTVQTSFPSTNCALDTVYFLNTTSVTLGNIIGYKWDFGDGDTSFLANPSHMYTTAGNYQVCLRVFTDSGCDTTVCEPITIFSRPTADFDFVNNVCLNEQPNQFLNLSTNPSGNIISYEWFFGDGNTATQINPLHSYAVAGTYTVKLRVTNDDGCLDSVSKQITIYPIPAASFQYVIQSGDSCGAPQVVQFTNYSNNAGGYYWDFNYLNNPGQDTSILMHPNFTYLNPGTYTVMMISKNGLGCSDTAFQVIRIHPFPSADFMPNTTAGCAPLTVNFTNLTSLPTGFTDSISYTWYFGDGATTKGKFPTHIYNTPGVYTVKLLARTVYGCEDTIVYQNLITVFPVPEAKYTYQLIEFDLFQFQNNTTNGTQPYIHSWNFGDGGTSSEVNPLHRFVIDRYMWAYGYPVCLTVTDDNGCTSTYCDTIKLGAFTLYVPNALVPDGTGEERLFLPKGQGLSAYNLKIFDRWGNLLWQTDKLDPIMASPVEGWDGTYKGEPVPPGVYVWRIDAKFANGVTWGQEDESYSNSGTITILR